MRRLMRLFCAVAGHDWAPPVPTGIRRENESLYRTECGRCDRTLSGDWYEMERHGAWQHFRSGL